MTRLEMTLCLLGIRALQALQDPKCNVREELEDLAEAWDLSPSDPEVRAVEDMVSA